MASVRPRAAPRSVALRRGLLPAGVFLAAAVLSGMTILDGIQPNDEGLMLRAAARIADGQVPYSDFWWYYPPGQPYLLAGLWELLGPSLLHWRLLRVLTDAIVALLAFVLARRRAPTGLALAAALGAALAMAYPTSPHPFPVSLALALGALLAFERSPVWAGVLVGVCAVWRLEFAGYVGLGIALAYLARPVAGGLGSRERWSPVARLCLPAAALALALYAPVVATAGLGTSWDMIVRYPLFDFGDYQGLPFPLDFDGPLAASSIGELRSTGESLLQFYLPLALVVGLAGALVSLALRYRRDAWPEIASAVFALGMAHYLLVRPDIFHTAPLAVMVAVLAAWALAGARERGRGAALVPTSLAALSLAFLVLEGADRRVLALEEDTVPLHLQVADGVRDRPEQAAPLERAVRYVRERVPAGSPIYLTTRRADLVTSGNPLFYVLADRPNPTRYDIAAPGVVTSAPVQREIVRDLERERVPLVVRFDDPITTAPEPNRAGEPTGVVILDDYLARRYRPAARFGPYVMLERE
jgi:hypothetical protein